MAWYLLIKRGTLLGTPLKTAVANFGMFSKKVDYKKCYRILEIDESSDQEQIRAAYLVMVKRYHPDSGTEEANAEKFQEIDKAFRILIKKKSQERWAIEEAVILEDEPDIKHIAPQHRQYLSYEGIGSGNPFQRQKQYTNVRALKAAENVYEHRVAKAKADDQSILDKNLEKVPLKHKIKTTYGFDRLVEDLIQESMSKGEFNNLKGSGKPLSSYQNKNPYVDFVTHKLNEVLIDNGFAPEWIMLEKDIRKDAHQLRDDLLNERKLFGPYPLNVEENIKWSDIVYRYSKVVDQINKKITKFNLVVPILNKQMLHISLKNEAQRAMVNGKSCEDFRSHRQRWEDRGKCEESSSGDSTMSLFSLIDYLFKGK